MPVDLTVTDRSATQPIRRCLVEEAAVDSHKGERESLSERITKAASKQSYYTIKLLADRNHAADAFRAYAYFRWVDDQIDETHRLSPTERQDFVYRQQALIDTAYRGTPPPQVTPEEAILLDMIRHDQERDSGLQSYIRSMMAVMAFDAERRGRLISAEELERYTHHLAVAVTEALLHCIGHDQPAPQCEARYLAVTAAHITHMLRDTYEDVDAGYYNIPAEVLDARGISPRNIHSDSYREWVKSRVDLAKQYFQAGKTYLAQIKSRRCRIAGFAYTARFEVVLDAIAREGYWLRPDYPDRKSATSALRIGLAALRGI